MTSDLLSYLQATAPHLARDLTLERLRFVEQVGAAYREGWEKGVRDFAIWKDGEQLVGCLQRPLAEVLKRGPQEA